MNKKLKIVAVIVLLISPVVAWAAAAYMNLTSDRAKVYLARAGAPMPQARYIPPQINVYPKFMTNIRPLVVEITISSNVEQMTLWWDEGYARTNYSTLASNVISVTTNEVGRP